MDDKIKQIDKLFLSDDTWLHLVEVEGVKYLVACTRDGGNSIVLHNQNTPD